jgi:hypothetical protein
MNTNSKPLGTYQMQDAIDLWADGYDTLQIAEFFNRPESYIYKMLPKWRAVFTPTVIARAA